MKVQASVKRICANCTLKHRGGHLICLCSKPKHKQRQG